MFEVGDRVRLKDDHSRDGVQGVVTRVGLRQTRVAFMRLPWTPTEKQLPEMTDFPHDQLRLCKDPWHDARDGKWSPLDSALLRIRAAELWLANTQGQLGSARTDLLPHQVCLVDEVLDRNRRRLLIAEEVGMGKTIETGMIIHALIQRRELERCLVVCPAGQIRQWQEELEGKLGLRFEIYREDVDGQRAFSFSRVIASLDTIKLENPNQRLRGKSHKDIVLEAPRWDLVVFDEAHRLTAKSYGNKTDKTFNYRLAEELCEQTRDFLFLTGTPHDGDDAKFRNLLKALDPEVNFDDPESDRFYGKIILKNRKSQARGPDGERLFKRADVIPVLLGPKDDGERQFHEKVVEYLREGYGVAKQDPASPRSRALGFVMTTFQKLASSSTTAIKSALRKRLSTVRGTPISSPPPDASPDDRYEGEIEEIEAQRRQAAELREGFIKLEASMLQTLVDFPVPSDAKWEELKSYIDKISAANPTEKFLIFSEYRGTVGFLKEQLEASYGEGSCETIMGGMGAGAKMDVIDRFRDSPKIRFLISTEAGGEGINLQFCHLVVNYDLPWNPFRLVQRIGRVHRIGQKFNMQVFNYRIQNDLDERLSDCHETRVDNAVERLAATTGMDAADIRDQLLGIAQEFIDYERLYRDALIQSNARSSEREIEEGIRRAEAAFQTAYEKVFRHAVSPFNPDRFDKLVGKTLDLADLRDWLDGYLKAEGRRLMHRKDTDLYEFLMPEALRHDLPPKLRTVVGTFDRKRAMAEATTPLLAFGHPCIDLILRHALVPEADGHTALAAWKKTGKAAGFVAVFLVRTDSHAGGGAFRLMSVFCPEDDGACSLLEQLTFVSSEAPAPSAATSDLATVRARIEEAARSVLIGLDFVEDRIYWVSLINVSTVSKS